MNARLLLALAATLPATTLLGQTWTNLVPNPYPTTLARRAGGFVFNPVQGAMVLYGGLQSGPTLVLNDTWTFDGSTWVQLSPATTPPPRWGHRLVYDSWRGLVVTFGGRSPTTTAVANDTWEWDGANWVQAFPTASPNARAFYSMVFDERRGRTIVYGTQSGSTLGTAGGNQTWEYDGTTWVQVTTAFVPPGLETPAMAYDKGRGVTVMFGGWNGAAPGVMYNTTWEYDGTNWVQRSLPTAPIARYRAGCVYDEARGRVVLYGGFGNASALQDTWEYDGNDWLQVQSGGPTRSTEAQVGYLPTLQTTVHFGGSGPGGTANETWIYSGATTAIAAKFGQGCATSAGVPDFNPATRPVLGTNYTLDLTNGTFNGLAFLVHGFSNTSSLFGPLPADLTGAGLAGCTLQISTDAPTIVGIVNGLATQVLPLPNDPAFTNLTMFSQALVLDTTAPNGTGGMSNAVHAVLGQ